MEKDLSREILSEITIFNKYAKYLPDKNRRETWNEIVTRNKEMHIEKFPKLSKDIEWAYSYVYSKKILPSMRSLQFAGKAAKINPARLYNCSFMIIDDLRAFQEAMYLLLSGCGVGFSVQKHHVEKLPDIRKPNPNRRRRYVIADSMVGWSDAIKVLIKSYFGASSSSIDFDYRDIRPKGSLLVTSGGKAPGPKPLRECLVKIQGLLEAKNDGDKLSTLEAHTIMCFIADAVLSGGIRRAALISLFSIDDVDMLSCKSGNWWELHPELGRANNTAVIVRSKVKKDDFIKLWGYIKASGAGEPGIMWTNNPEIGANPCFEISLRNMQMCNLVEINASDIESQDDINNRSIAASIIGTLQASYTDFHYLRDNWRTNCEKDALLGVSMTGIASMKLFKYDIEEAAKCAVDTNEKYASIIGIRKAARVTAIKPAGTTSLVLGTSSGIHAWHDKFYWRRIRLNKSESMYRYLVKNNPELLEDDFFSPNTTSIIKVPQMAPEGAVLRDEPALTLLDRVKVITEKWINPGFRSGYNQHNVSCTVSIRDNEWDDVMEWMWHNKDIYTGISVLPYDNHTYVQAPFESCTKEEYDKAIVGLKNIDISLVTEQDDNTDLSGEVACGGSGSCEVK